MARPTANTARQPVDTILHGDCIAVIGLMETGSIDKILTDPRYITRYRSRDGRSVRNDDNDRWLAPAFRGAHRVLRPGGSWRAPGLDRRSMGKALCYRGVRVDDPSHCAFSYMQRLFKRADVWRALELIPPFDYSVRLRPTTYIASFG